MWLGIFLKKLVVFHGFFFLVENMIVFFFHTNPEFCTIHWFDSSIVNLVQL